MEDIELNRFDDWVEANEFYSLLNKECIGVKLEEASETDHAMAQVSRKYVVKIRKDEYAHAQQVLLKAAEADLAEVDKNYPLFSFSDEELIDIVLKPEEWSVLDYVLAQKILKARGKSVSPELAEAIRKQRLQDLSRKEDSSKAWIAFGYVSALLGGLIGIVMGWHLFSHKKELPNGEQIFAFTDADRLHGYRIFYLGIVMLVLWVVMRVLYAF